MKLNHELGLLNERCKNEPDFASKPAPWDSSLKAEKIVEEAVETNVAPVAADMLLRKQLRVHSGKTQPRVTHEPPKGLYKGV